MALSLYKHNQYGTLSYEQVDSNWDDIESDVNGLSSRLPLNNYSATTNPTVNDDVTQGYSNGSLWYNRTTDTAFVLTNASSGAANWVERDSISASDLGSAAFSDIVGTVSQSGGVPTGAIIERGSNANGEYLKLADGTTCCWDILTASYESSAACLASWTYPTSFVSGPSLLCSLVARSATPTATEYGSIISIIGGGSATIRQYRIAGLADFQPGDTVQISATARGRWYTP